MISISFTVPGQMSGKGRAKTGQGGHHYTPAKTRSQEAIVRHYANEAMRNVARMKGPLRLLIHVYRHPPQSWSKKRKAAAVWITGKPDWDNLGKLVSDAMNGIVYADDSQIADANVKRRYLGADAASVPDHLRIIVQTLEGEP